MKIRSQQKQLLERLRRIKKSQLSKKQKKRLHERLNVMRKELQQIEKEVQHKEHLLTTDEGHRLRDMRMDQQQIEEIWRKNKRSGNNLWKSRGNNLWKRGGNS